MAKPKQTKNKQTKKVASKTKKTVAKKATKKVAKLAKKTTSKTKKMSAPKMKSKAKKVTKATKAAVANTKTAARATRATVLKTKANSEVKTPSVKIQMTRVTTMPDLTLAATGGQTINLKSLAGKKVILYFYPKDMTPGCTIEGHEFTKLKEEFENHNTVVFGVSRDTVELHEKFKAKECYTIDLLADTDEKLCQTFDVIKDKNMYGKKVRGIERSTFMIDENGQIVKEWRGVKAEGHAQEVLTYLTTTV